MEKMLTLCTRAYINCKNESRFWIGWVAMIPLARIFKWLKIRKSRQINFWHLGRQCLSFKNQVGIFPVIPHPYMLPTNDFELIERLPSLCLPPLLPPFGFFSALGLLESGLMHVHIYFHVHTNPHNLVSLIWPLFHTSASTYNLFRISILIFDFTWCINHEKASNIHRGSEYICKEARKMN